MTPTRSVDPGAYGRNWAADYDELYENRDDPSAVVALVSRMAPPGPILEFGVGTGRLAVPLVAAGRHVTGVDASPEMLELLRRRTGGEQVEAVQGDFTNVRVEGSFAAVLIAFSTLFLVPSQEGQISCLGNAARHLRPGGVVLIEAFVPDHSRWTRGQNVTVAHVDEATVDLHVATHDAVNQVVTTQNMLFNANGVSLRPNVIRYAWPAELDAMARVAGLTPAQRWADWSQTPFTAQSTTHVSMYVLPGEAS